MGIDFPFVVMTEVLPKYGLKLCINCPELVMWEVAPLLGYQIADVVLGYTRFADGFG